MIPEEIEQLLQRFGITGASQYGVKASDITSLAAEVNVDRLGNNPHPISEKDIAAFYTAIV